MVSPGFGKEADNNIYRGNMNTDTGQYWVLKVPAARGKRAERPAFRIHGSLPDNVVHAPNDTIMSGSPNMWGPRVGAAHRLFSKKALLGSAGVFSYSWGGVYQSACGIGGNWPMVATTMYGNLNNPTPTALYPNAKMNAEYLGAARNTAVVPGPGDPTARLRFPYTKPTYFAKSIGRSNYGTHCRRPTGGGSPKA